MPDKFSDWIPHIVFFALSNIAALAAYLFKLNIDFKKQGEKIDSLENLLRNFSLQLGKFDDIYVPSSSLESKLIDYASEVYASAKEMLRKEKETDIYDFEKGWNLLFKEIFSQRSGMLRDVTFSSHGDESIQSYDFSLYPDIVLRNLLEERMEGAHKIHFLVVCEPSCGQGNNNKRAEKYLLKLLEIKYPDSEDLLNRWAVGDLRGRDQIEIRIANEKIVKQAMRHAKDLDLFGHPFNVYDNFAVSRSIVRGAKTNDTNRRPLPHLSISIDPEKITEAIDFFDLVWRQSEGFTYKALGELDAESRANFGKSGKSFDRWSSLDWA